MNAVDHLKVLADCLEVSDSAAGQNALLREMGDVLVTECALDLGGGALLRPLRVEPYYHDPLRRPDENTHQSPRQRGAEHFGMLYFHRKGWGGVDVCLARGNYFLSFLIKNARLGEEVFRQVDLFRRLRPRKGELEAGARLVPAPRREIPVYHTYRVGLVKGRDTEPLASLVEIEARDRAGRGLYSWDRGHGKRWTLEHYHEEHPAENR